jgi:hypothetical protein
VTAALPEPLIGYEDDEHQEPRGGANADLVGRILTMTDWRRPAHPIDRTFTVTGTPAWSVEYVVLDDGDGGSIIRPAGLIRRRLQVDAD